MLKEFIDRKIQEDRGVLSHEFFLAAGETNAQARLPLPLLVNRLIRVATEHANLLNVGYAQFAPQGRGWVLLKLSIEMERYPRIDEDYTVTTWVEATNKLLSFRNYAIISHGQTVGCVRSQWAMIDMTTRRMCDITSFDVLVSKLRPDLVCPIAPQPKLKGVEQGRTWDFTFGYCDVDFNRHVNTVRYFELLMNQWSIDHYDRYQVQRIDVAFIKECLYGSTVTVTVDDSNPLDCLAQIASSDGTTHCRARIRFDAIRN